jgi:hypothetical protein
MYIKFNTTHPTIDCEYDLCPFCVLLPEVEEKEKEGKLNDAETVQLFLLRSHVLLSGRKIVTWRRKNGGREG